MKLPNILEQLIRPKAETRELFLSLLLNGDSIAAAAWYMDPSGEPHLLSHASAPVAKDAWDHRTEVTDRLLTVVEEKAGSKTAIEKVVLGLPHNYLDVDGSILSAVRPHIKALTKKLDLSPVGFVPVHDAIAYMMKREDGVPASVILIHVTRVMYTVFLYRVGTLVGTKTFPATEEHVTQEVEAVLKEFQDHDVLPSRMILYGGDAAYIETVKSQLLTYPWTTRANFLHFPKIEILPTDGPIGAVCFAGAKELGSLPAQVGMGDALETAAQAPEEPESKQEETEQIPTEENVVEVAPEEFGFKKEEDILSVPPQEESAQEQPKPAKIQFPKIKLPKIPALKITKAPIVAGVVVLLAIFFLAFWSVPKATVTVLVSPKTIEKSTTVIVNPTATVADSATGTLPGAVQEKSVTGEKTLPVTGKKSVGDPAKGTVTIYNKVTSARNLQKGTVLSAGSLQFTLDEAVSVASASESIGSITFGKKDAAITASAIGTQSNLTAGTEFVFKDISSSSLSARNEQPIAGGTSREVTVVSRTDYNAVVKALSDELVIQAKEDLATGVSGGQKLIDATIKTEVAEQTFTQELDQESQEVSGKVTLTISGLSYNEADISAIIAQLASPDVPSGYELAPSRTSVTVNSTKTQKDGSVSMPITFKALALPLVDEAAVRSAIAGKKLDNAQSALAQFEGVAGIDVAFRFSPWKNRLPMNKNNISVTVAIRE